jgi:hypothetical protein
MFSGRYPRQGVKIFEVSVPETSENFYILTRMSAREYFIEFFCRESFETHIPYNQRVHHILTY